MKDIDKLMTLGNYARFKDIPRETVYQLEQKGTVEFVKIDNVIFVKVEKYKNIDGK